MDDQHFDKTIKGHLENYEGPDFDPTALADLRYRLASITTVPWYVRYRTELIVISALLFFTLFNVLWQSQVEVNREQSFIQVMDSLKTSQRIIIDLQQQLSALRRITPDSDIASLVASAPTSTLKSDEVDNLLSLILEEKSKNDPRVIALLGQVSEFLRSEQGMNGDQSPPATNLSLLPSATYHFPLPAPSDSARISLDQVTLKENGGTEEAKEKHLTAAMARELKKHFQKGVGIRLGPAASLSAITYSPGPRVPSVGGGLMSDWILSPSLSMETGIIYAPRFYDWEGSTMMELQNLPGVDESLGSLKEVDITSQVVQFPLNLKLYIPLSSRTEGVLGGGYSFLLYLRQDLEYGYQFNDDFDGRFQGLKSTYEQAKPRFYPGTLNLSAGASTLLKNDARLEFSLYYQYGLGDSGLEQVKANSFGLRTAYWFTIR